MEASRRRLRRRSFLQLIGEGELRFDDTVERWLPGLLPAGERISVRQLLNHTSGLYNYTESSSFVRRVQQEILAGAHFTLTPRKGIALAAKEPLRFDPGTSWEYSNTNYQVLGLIVERVTGHTFAEELERRILGPLGLHSTRLEVGVIRGPHARSYILPDGPRSLPGGRPLAVDGHNTGAWAAGALVSNVNDLATFFGALVDGNLLPARLQKAMFTQTSKVPYGLGITRSERRGNRTVGLSKTPRRS